MTLIIPETPADAQPPAKPTDTCPAWCNAPHDGDSEHWRTHRLANSVRVLNGKAFFRLTWWEGRNAVARYQDRGPEIFFATEPRGQMTLTVQRARDLAQIMQELGHDEVAAMLRQAADMAGEGR